METITLTPQGLKAIIADAVAQGIRAYEASKSGEVSYRKGVELYGKWFVGAVDKGLIKGLKRGAKSNSKTVYQIADIEALRRKEIAQTTNIINTITHK